jgi:hypothetical protein
MLENDRFVSGTVFDVGDTWMGPPFEDEHKDEVYEFPRALCG